MAGKLPMGAKELVRAKTMEQVRQKQLSLRQAAVKMKVSERQAKRIWARYRTEGDCGLLHKSQGRPSNRRIAEPLRLKVLESYKEKYPDFGPTLAAEKLGEEEGIRVDHETLRRWLMEAGEWSLKRRGSRHRSRRRRRERFGELVQFDGSPHGWFEKRGPSCCLMNMVDDATGRTYAFLAEQETTESAMRLLWGWIGRYGIPQALYCDRKNAFVLDREPTLEEQLAGREPQSPFQLACRKLGIELIVAHSPQAKGRVERSHGVYQDRFVKELRLAGISSLEQANRFLETTYLPAINRKFAKSPAEPEDAHVPLVDRPDLADVFCFEFRRVVSRDYVLQFERKLYQIPQRTRLRPRPTDRVVVRKWLDGSVHFYWKDRPLLVEEIPVKTSKEEEPASIPA